MKADDLKVTDGELAGGWIEPRLGGLFGAVTLQVPRGFEAYARIFHPATDFHWNPVRWAVVAEAFGTTVHREMQWHAILGLGGPEELQVSYGADSAIGKKWRGHDPATGEMDFDELDALCEILALHTADPDQCYFGLCMIQSWESSFSADELKPRLKLPAGRDHIVLTGPLAAVGQIARDLSGTSSFRAVFVAPGDEPPTEFPKKDWGPRRDVPNLIWPADRSWFVASEVDFDSTLVGGSTELIKAIVDSPALEAWQVEPTDSLASDADKINGTQA